MIEGLDFISSNEILLPYVLISNLLQKNREVYGSFRCLSFPFDKKMQNIDHTWETIDTRTIYYICICILYTVTIKTIFKFSLKNVFKKSSDFLYIWTIMIHKYFFKTL